MQIPWTRPFFGDEEKTKIMETLESGWLSQGEKVRMFEREVALITGSAHTVAVNSGTAALDVALKLLKIRPGDEVMVPALSYIATVNAVLYQGAVPVFVDVDPETYTIDADQAREAMGPACRALIAIDYAGQAAPWGKLRALAEETGIALVEDAAPGFGGRHADAALGTLGDVGITSFHAAKIFNSVEGGMLFLRSEQMAERARIIRAQGESAKTKYHHLELGHNYRMSDLHAAVGLAQLNRFEHVTDSREICANYYLQKLSNIPGLRLPTVKPENRHAWFLFPVLMENRDSVRSFLKERGIDTNISWPYPAYVQPYLKKYFRARCPVTEEICRKILSLPLFYGLEPGEQDRVIDTLKGAKDNHNFP